MNAPNEARLEALATGECTYPSCNRRAVRGHTTCGRHYTAGRVLKKLERESAARQLKNTEPRKD